MKNSVAPARQKPADESFALMKSPDPENALPGDLVIHESAVSSIIRRVVTGIQGISRLAGSSFVDNIAEIVRSRKMQDRAIVLHLSEDTVSVEISIYVYLGFSIPEAAAALQKAVIDKVTGLTGLKVSNVDINVRGVDENPAEEAGESSGQA